MSEDIERGEFNGDSAIAALHIATVTDWPCLNVPSVLGETARRKPKALTSLPPSLVELRRTSRSWGYARRWLFFAIPSNYKQSTQTVGRVAKVTERPANNKKRVECHAW